jgi:hypothetical protein
MYKKMVIYDRKTKDFTCYLNGEIVGYATTYPLACALLNQKVYEILSKPTPAKTPPVDSTK